MCLVKQKVAKVFRPLQPNRKRRKKFLASGFETCSGLANEIADETSILSLSLFVTLCKVLSCINEILAHESKIQTQHLSSLNTNFHQYHQGPHRQYQLSCFCISYLSLFLQLYLILLLVKMTGLWNNNALGYFLYVCWCYTFNPPLA